jgi:hypothetical protein
VNLASADCHLSGTVLEDAIVLLSKPFDHFVILLGFFVTQFAVINMKANGHLFTIDHLVSNAGIVWVELEPIFNQALSELAIEQ